MLECVACDDALRVLQEEKIYEEVMTHLTSRVQKLLEIRAGPDMEVGAALFSKVYGLLGKTGNTEALIQKITEE